MNHELVKVKNVGSQPVRIKLGVSSYDRIAPGDETLMSWEHYVATFGHPWLKNVDTNKARDREHHRASSLHWRDRDLPWEEFRPQVEVESIDGEQITPLFDDPTGDGITGTDMTKETAAKLQQQVTSLEQQLRKMQALQKAQNPEADLPADEPKKVPTGKR